MTLDKIRELVEKNKYKQKTFIFKGTRNQIDKFKGKIKNTYSVIFTVVSEDNKLRSFSYSDVLIGNLQILD